MTQLFVDDQLASLAEQEVLARLVENRPVRRPRHGIITDARPLACCMTLQLIMT